jgi:hypothetical protein
MASLFEGLDALLLPNGVVGYFQEKNPELAAELASMIGTPNGVTEKSGIRVSPCYKDPKHSLCFDHTLREFGDYDVWLNVNNPDTRWSITVQHQGAPLYGLDFYIKFNKKELFDAVRKSSEHYVVSYQRDGVPQFAISLFKYIERGYHFVRLQVV